MALSSAMVWEVRTTGSDNNGGGFVAGATGTDYSQQDSAQDSGTDLACADGDAAAPAVTSATHTFDANDVGNIINITEAGTGFTLGRYQIVSVAGGAATLDRACGADGALTGGDWYLGGALATIDLAASVLVSDNIVYVKAGTYGETVTLDTSVSTTGHIIQFIGYNSTRTDNPTGTNRPLISGGSARANCVVCGTKVGTLFANFRFENATGDGVTASPGALTHFVNCKAASNGSEGWGGTTKYSFYHCEAGSNSASGFYDNYGAENMFSYSHDNSNAGFYVGNGNGIRVCCVADTNTSHGFYFGADEGLGTQYTNNSGEFFINCVAYNNTGATSDGFYLTFTSDKVYFLKAINCISKDNGRYGFNNNRSGSRILFFDKNCYHGNGTAGLNNFTAGSGDVTSDPSFTDAPNKDFTLGAASPCLNVGRTVGSNEGLVGTY